MWFHSRYRWRCDRSGGVDGPSSEIAGEDHCWEVGPDGGVVRRDSRDGFRDWFQPPCEVMWDPVLLVPGFWFTVVGTPWAVFQFYSGGSD